MKKLFTKEMGKKIAMTALAVVAAGVPAFAGGQGASTTFTMPPVVTNFLGIIMWALLILGAFTFIFGAIQMGFAFKNDDADGKSKGMRAMLAGAIVFIVAIAGNAILMPYLNNLNQV